jgi:hypothetical protein
LAVETTKFNMMGAALAHMLKNEFEAEAEEEEVSASRLRSKTRSLGFDPDSDLVDQYLGAPHFYSTTEMKNDAVVAKVLTAPLGGEGDGSSLGVWVVRPEAAYAPPTSVVRYNQVPALVLVLRLKSGGKIVITAGVAPDPVDKTRADNSKPAPTIGSVTVAVRTVSVPGVTGSESRVEVALPTMAAVLVLSLLDFLFSLVDAVAKPSGSEPEASSDEWETATALNASAKVADVVKEMIGYWREVGTKRNEAIKVIQAADRARRVQVGGPKPPRKSRKTTTAQASAEAEEAARADSEMVQELRRALMPLGRPEVMGSLQDLLKLVKTVIESHQQLGKVRQALELAVPEDSDLPLVDSIMKMSGTVQELMGKVKSGEEHVKLLSVQHNDLYKGFAKMLSANGFRIGKMSQEFKSGDAKALKTHRFVRRMSPTSGSDSDTDSSESDSDSEPENTGKGVASDSEEEEEEEEETEEEPSPPPKKAALVPKPSVDATKKRAAQGPAPRAPAGKAHKGGV